MPIPVTCVYHENIFQKLLVLRANKQRRDTLAWGWCTLTTRWLSFGMAVQGLLG